LLNYVIKKNSEILLLNREYKVVGEDKYKNTVILNAKQFLFAKKCKCCDKIVYVFNNKGQRIQVDAENISFN
jgi:hypothetical protein